MSKMSIMLIMLTVIISDSSDQSNHLQDSDYSIITQSLLLYNLMQKSFNINKKVLDEMYENDESIEETSNCKCSEIFKMILKKVYRKLFTVIDMMNEMKCINTLRIFVKTDLKETSLMHVCHKHFLRLADHFDLQVKMLNSAELRN